MSPSASVHSSGSLRSDMYSSLCAPLSDGYGAVGASLVVGSASSNSGSAPSACFIRSHVSTKSFRTALSRRV